MSRQNASVQYAQKRLFDLQDKKYRDFHSALIPNVPKEKIIGVRMPLLRALAKELWSLSKNEAGKGKEISVEEFMSALPHDFYEENNLHFFFIGMIRDYEECLSQTEHFLPQIDNWATCDIPLPRALSKNPCALYPHILRWLNDGRTYVVRFAVGALLSRYLDDDFKKEHLSLVASIDSPEYYVNMMRAWYFATALAKQWDAALPLLEKNRLDAWTHNKTIQKAVESRRIPQEKKELLRGLRRKV